MTMGVKCIDCGVELEWGMEYQLEGGGDHHAVCPECKREREADDR